MPPPAKRQINNLTRCRDFIKSFQGLKHNGSLLLSLARLAKRMAKGPLQIDAARWLHLLRVFPNDGYAHGGNAGFLNFSLYQSHGLIADASSRCEQDQIHLILLESFCDIPGRLADQGGDVASVNMAHE